MIKIVLDAIIPADSKLSMPSASEIDFSAYVIKHQIKKIVRDFLVELTKSSNEQFSNFFTDLNEDEKIKALNQCKLKNVRLFSDFLKHVFSAYYSDIRVLSLLEVGSLPPFPIGNIISEDDDWTILMSVYERGSIYREVDDGK
jgi:hypothetical protein